MKNPLLPGLPVDLIRQRYAAAPGNELESGKFESPESSAALAANAFGFFLDKPEQLPPLPGLASVDWPVVSVQIEEEIRFPWSGGRHPWLDAVIDTTATLIGVESKRYEPFRSKGKISLSDAYWRPVWGDDMARYSGVRDGLKSGAVSFDRLDATQLVKHAYGLRTAVHRTGDRQDKQPILVYLYAEPNAWPDSKAVPAHAIKSHRHEIEQFATMIKGDEVTFLAISYQELLKSWRDSSNNAVRDHADAIGSHFKV
ncbi:MAG: hypothetical protein O3B74_10935 [Proteobacteria bacterium]|nr:hypothetical protein [Pseudomonadota bacterium]